MQIVKSENQIQVFPIDNHPTLYMTVYKPDYMQIKYGNEKPDNITINWSGCGSKDIQFTKQFVEGLN
jgi:hypothetical protein